MISGLYVLGLTCCRHRVPSKLTRRNTTWMRSTLTSPGMRSDGTRRVGSRKTTRAKYTREAASTQHMCTMNSSSIRGARSCGYLSGYGTLDTLFCSVYTLLTCFASYS